MKSSLLDIGAKAAATYAFLLLAASSSFATAATTASAFVRPTSSASSIVARGRRPSATTTTTTRVVVVAPVAAVVRPQIREDVAFVPPDVINDGGITEISCVEAASRMRRVMVPVSSDVCEAGCVGISYIHWKADEEEKRKRRRNASSSSSSSSGGGGGGGEGGDVLPLLLVHGFDSSSLEYRRLGPLLSSLGIDVYCVDLLGWGYTQLDPSVLSYSARAKVEALRGFWEVVGGNGEVVVGGASLGGAAVIEYAADVLRRGDGSDDDDDDDYYGGGGGDFVRGTVLIDAQGFVDGIGPMSYLPAPIARLGIRVLKSEPLRSSANRMSYYDVESYATEDALRVGRLHTLREGWEDGMLSFMRSGGFRPREKVSTIGVPTLVLWGRQDGILDGEEYANMFVNGMPDATLRWIEECGHVPHLEQPETTARHIADFLMSEGVRPSRKKASATGGNILEGIFRLLN